jgi:hypothetical protein
MKNKRKVNLILAPATLLRAQWEFELVMEVNVCEEPVNVAAVGPAILEAARVFSVRFAIKFYWCKRYLV